MRLPLVALLLAVPVVFTIGCAVDTPADETGDVNAAATSGFACKKAVDDNSSGDVRSTTTSTGLKCFTASTGDQIAGCISARATATIKTRGLKDGRVEVTATSSCNAGSKIGDAITCWAPMQYLCEAGEGSNDNILAADTCFWDPTGKAGEGEPVRQGDCRTDPMTASALICKRPAGLGQSAEMELKKAGDTCNAAASASEAKAATQKACEGRAGKTIDSTSASYTTDYTFCGKADAAGTWGLDSDKSWVTSCVNRGGQPKYNDFLRDTCECLCP